MDIDFKENIIRLMQHPIMHKPISELTSSEQSQAREILENLYECSMDENCTQIDYIQISRLRYALGDLAYAQCSNPERIIKYLLSSLHSLEKGGIDLSLNKWAELVNLRQSSE
ncbi:hypothetical protein [Bacteroides faecium]|uniref:Uncharacterized protein n=1 Tax=Bacteroides faecium TaxID=2715212 RepID=A0A6H0KKU2_9BACE|nr:hypothetical protein [Bacteroides faecium]QIU92977.1 hypothetical protein BacF7301_01915 [Bacteroides faecium]